MIIERDNLKYRIKKLEAGLENKSMPETEIPALTEQHNVMTAYLNILNFRIDKAN